MNGLFQDLRYTFRTLRHDMGFTIFAVLIVGLGIGASSIVFSIVNALLLRPIPFKDPASLVWIANVADDGVKEWRIQGGHVFDLREEKARLFPTLRLTTVTTPPGIAD